jgi:hypothetical protein
MLPVFKKLNWTLTSKVTMKLRMPPPLLCFELFGGCYLGRRMNDTDTKIVFIFAYVAFSGLSHMTYFSETRDTKTALRERVI